MSEPFQNPLGDPTPREGSPQRRELRLRVEAMLEEFERERREAERAAQVPRERTQIPLSTTVLCLDMQCRTVYDVREGARCPRCAGEAHFPIAPWLDAAERARS